MAWKPHNIYSKIAEQLTIDILFIIHLTWDNNPFAIMWWQQVPQSYMVNNEYVARFHIEFHVTHSSIKHAQNNTGTI